MLGSYTGEYPKIAAGAGNRDTRLETPQRLTVQTPAPARGTYVRLSRDPWGGPERTTSHSRLQKGVAGRENSIFLVGCAHSRPTKASRIRIGCSYTQGCVTAPHIVCSDGRLCTSWVGGHGPSGHTCESPVTYVKQTKQTNKERSIWTRVRGRTIFSRRCSASCPRNSLPPSV